MTLKLKTLFIVLCCIALSNTELRAQDLTLTQIQVQASDPEALADWYIKYLRFKSKSVRKLAGRAYVSVEMGKLMILFVPNEDTPPNSLSFESKDIKNCATFLLPARLRSPCR